MDLVNYDRCRMCLTDIEDLEQESETVYENFFCDCTGSARYICRTCIRNYIQRFPHHCNECHSQWRNVRLNPTTLSYQQFRDIVHRDGREGWGILGNFVWFILIVFGLALNQSRFIRGISTTYQIFEEWNPSLTAAFTPLIVIMGTYLLLLLSNYGVNQGVDHGFTPFLYILYLIFGRFFYQPVVDVEIFD